MNRSEHPLPHEGERLAQTHGIGHDRRLQLLAYHFDQTENTLLFHMDGDDFGDQTKNTIFSHQNQEERLVTKSKKGGATMVWRRGVKGAQPKSGVEGDFVNTKSQSLNTILPPSKRRITEISLRNSGIQEIKNRINFDLDQNQNHENNDTRKRVFEDRFSHDFGFGIYQIFSVFNAFPPFTFANSAVKTAFNAFKLSAFSNKPLAFLFVFIRVHPRLKFVLNAFPLRFSAPFAVKLVLKTAWILLILNLIHVKTAFSQTASLPYTTGFESSQSFSLGAFPSTGNVWRPTGTVSIVNTPVFAGTQSLAIAPNGLNASRIQLNLNAATTTNQIVFADFYLQGVVGSVADLATITKSNSAVMMVLVQTGAEAELYVANGLGNGTISQWVATGRKWSISGKSMTGFKRVTARIDLVTQSWDLFLEGTPAALDIGFPRTKTSLNFMSVRGDAAGTTRLDNVSLATTNPLFTDLDKDGMDDTWESANGLNTAIDDRDLDKDGDGLTNLQEFVYGTRANVTDTDGDGISDSVEIANATNPNSELTVTETFESYVLNSLLAGQGKWTGSGTGSATVQSASVKEGSKAIKISSSAGSDYAIQRAFTTTEKGVWTDFYVRPVKRDGNTTPTLDANSALGAYFDKDAKLRIWDGTTSSWQTVTTNGVNTTQWQRLTFYHDYNTKKFSAWLNNVQVATNLGFRNTAVLKLNNFKISSGKGDTFLDRLSASISEPTGLDNDADELTNDQERTLGTNLSLNDTDSDGVWDGVEVGKGSDPKSATSKVGIFHTNATTGSDSNKGYSPTATDGTGPKKTLNGTFAVMISGDTASLTGNYSQTTISTGTRTLILRPQGNVKVTP